MKNAHYTHEFLCKSCGQKTIRYTKDKSPPKYCSSLCCQKDRIGYKINKERSLEKTLHSFLKRVIKKDGCWEWRGSVDKKGYACLTSRYLKQSKAHRISYILYKSEISNGCFILHNCNNPSCTNPDHLRIGNQEENMRDKVIGKRQSFRIDKKKEETIKTLICLKKFSDEEVAKAFKVSINAIIIIKERGSLSR
jgi:hypothetical protein